VGQGEGEPGDPVPVAVALGKVGIEDTFLDVAAHAENLVVCGDARGHAIHDFVGVVCHKLKVEHARRRDAFVDDSAGTAVVVKISRLLEQANGRALAGVDDSDAGLRDSGG